MKESKSIPDKTVLFHETFLDWVSVAENSCIKIGTPTISNGILNLNGSSDAINIDRWICKLKYRTTNSIVIDFTTNNVTGTEEIISFGDTDSDTRIQLDNIAGKLRALVGITGTTYWYLNTDNVVFTNGIKNRIVLVQDGTSPVLYVNGIAPAQTFVTSTNKTKWFSQMSGIDNGRIGCGSWNSGGNTNWLNGSIELVNIYNRILSSTEISLLYKNQLYLDVLNNLIFHVPITNGSIVDRISGVAGTITGSVIGIRREGSKFVVYNNGTNGNYIEYAGTEALCNTGDFTISCWCKPLKYTVGGEGFFTKNNQITGWAITNYTYFRFYNGSNNIVQTFSLGWHNFIFTYNSTISQFKVYDNNIYVNLMNNVYLTNTIKIKIGAFYTDINSYCLADSVSDCRIYNKVLSLEEISRVYNSTKRLYSL